MKKRKMRLLKPDWRRGTPRIITPLINGWEIKEPGSSPPYYHVFNDFNDVVAYLAAAVAKPAASRG
jgi:hypothetical protein